MVHPQGERDLKEAGLHPRVVVPAVFSELSRGRVLTMGYEPGVHSSDRTGITALGLEPQAVASLLSRTLCHQVFRTGFVHCDPHPANVLVRPLPPPPTPAAAAPDADPVTATPVAAAVDGAASGLTSILRDIRRCVGGGSVKRPRQDASESNETTNTAALIEPQLVLLDHGLYREISPAHRIQWCSLWKGIVLGDAVEIRRASEAMGFQSSQMESIQSGSR